MVFSNRLSPSGQGRSDAPQGLPPVAALYRLLNGYLIGRAIHVAAQLGVADVLREGPRSTTEIATAVGAHAPTLYRLLRALASVGLFTEVEHGSFALTPVGDCLRSDVPVSLRALISLSAPTSTSRPSITFCRLCRPAPHPSNRHSASLSTRISASTRIWGRSSMRG